MKLPSALLALPLALVPSIAMACPYAEAGACGSCGGLSLSYAAPLLLGIFAGVGSLLLERGALARGKKR